MSLAAAPQPAWTDDCATHEEPYQDIRILHNGRTVARVGLDDAPVHDFNDFQREDATFILKACNLHVELVDMLKQMLRSQYSSSSLAGVRARLERGEAPKNRLYSAVALLMKAES